MKSKFITLCLVSCLSLVLFSACSSNDTAAENTTSELPSPSVATDAATDVAPATPEDAPTVEYIPTEVLPEEPLAARFNDRFVMLADWEREVERREAGMAIAGIDPATQSDYKAQVLEEMIIEGLILQAAEMQGYSVSDEEVEAAFQQSLDARGSQEALDEWLALNLYTADEWRQELSVQLLSAKIQTDVVQSVGTTAAQVHARHILVKTREEAEAVIAQLEGGADFATLAAEQSLDQSTKLNGGDLGWFPPRTLTIEDLERIAFEMQPGERSAPISSRLGYHVLEVLEFDEDREISQEALIVLQQAAIENWVEGLKAQSVVDRYVP